MGSESCRRDESFVVAVCLAVVISSLLRQTGSAALNATFALPDNRALITRQLQAMPGKHLVIVRTIWNIIIPATNWCTTGPISARRRFCGRAPKGQVSDADLCRDYSDRTFWSVTTDDVSYSLRPLALCKTIPPLRGNDSSQRALAESGTLPADFRFAAARSRANSLRTLSIPIESRSKVRPRQPAEVD